MFCTETTVLQEALTGSKTASQIGTDPKAQQGELGKDDFQHEIGLHARSDK